MSTKNKTSHNNFRNGGGRQRKWRLFCRFIPGSEAYKKWGECKTFYNWEPDSEEKKELLIKNIFQKYYSGIQIATLHTNNPDELIQKLK